MESKRLISNMVLLGKQMKLPITYKASLTALFLMARLTNLMHIT